MKIRELIEALSKYDWDSEVEIEGALSDSGYTINGITEETNYSKNKIVYLISYEVIDMDSDRMGVDL